MKTDKTLAINRCSKPQRICLAVVRDQEQERINIMPIGWHMWTSASPRQIAISIATSRYTHDLLQKEKEFVLAWPGEDMARGVLLCGTTSGRRIDKLEATAWETLPASRIETPLIERAIVNLECIIKSSLPTGDHTLFVGEVLEGHLNDDNRKLLLQVGTEPGFRPVEKGHGFRLGVAAP